MPKWPNVSVKKLGACVVMQGYVEVCSAKYGNVMSEIFIYSNFFYSELPLNTIRYDAPVCVSTEELGYPPRTSCPLRSGAQGRNCIA